MKKNLLLSIMAATLMLAGCSKDQSEVNPSSEQGLVPITFNSSSLEVSTRGLSTISMSKDYVVYAIAEFPEERTITEDRYAFRDTDVPMLDVNGNAITDDDGNIIYERERYLTTETFESQYGWYFVEGFHNGEQVSDNTYYWPVDGTKLSFYAFSSAYLDYAPATEMMMSRAIGLDATSISKRNIQDIARLNIIFSVDELNEYMDGDGLWGNAYMPEDGQDDLSVATAQTDVIYDQTETPEPVKLVFSHSTANVNINVRLDDELSAKYQIKNDNYTGFVSAKLFMYGLCPFLTNPNNCVAPTNHGAQMSSGYRSYNVLPQYIVGEHQYCDVSDDNEMKSYTGEVYIAIENLEIIDKTTGDSFDPDFSGTVEPYTLQSGDVEGDALQAGVEYTFTMVLGSLDLNTEDNIPFERDNLVVTAVSTAWTAEADKEFNQDVQKNQEMLVQ